MAENSNDVGNEPQVAKLLYIKVQNFKSFTGIHCFGPLTNFTSVIGPNGSGNSYIKLWDCLIFDLIPNSLSSQENLISWMPLVL